MALAPPSAGACRIGSVILTVKLIAGHDAVGERREPWPGRSRCRRSPRSGSVRRRVPAPAVIEWAGPRQAAMPGVRRGGAGRGDPGRQGAWGCGCPERPSFLFRITLSDGGGRGERARTRRSGRVSLRLACWPGGH